VINRENGLLEIYNRVKNDKDSLGLRAFKRTPTKPIDENFLPCVFMIEGVDDVVKPATRNNTGYPCVRNLEVTLEIVTDRDTDIKKLYTDVRSVVFNGGVIVADNNTFIREIRAEGPTGYGLPDVLGMQLVLMLVYTDMGTY